MNKNCVAILLLLLFDFCYGADKKEIHSPNGKIKLTVEAKENLFYSIKFNNEIILLPSEINLLLQDGTDLAGNLNAKKQAADSTIPLLFHPFPKKEKTFRMFLMSL